MEREEKEIEVISQELQRKILFYYVHEKWKMGTIARELRVHHETIRRVLLEAGFRKDACEPARKSLIEPFLPFIREELEKHPELTASRLFCMCCERGYKGRADHFRALIRRVRPQKYKEVFARLETTMGEQAQVDWGVFGKVPVKNGIRSLSGFVMVLSWSRAIYLEFFYDQTLASFLTGHNHALAWFGGSPRVALYDNLKSVVLERTGDAIRFNPEFLAFANKAGFEPRPVGVRRGNEKGRVERAIRYIRDNFFAGRSFKNLDDLNEQARRWCETASLERPCPADPALRVGQAFHLEKPSLRQLPGVLPAAEERLTLRVPKVPLLRIDGNDYAVPSACAHRVVGVRLSHEKVAIECEGVLVAEHTRSWDKRILVDENGYSKELTAKKSRAFEEGAKWRLLRSLPTFAAYLRAVAEDGGSSGSAIAAVGRLLDSHGQEAVEKALQEALAAAQLNTGAVALILDREAQRQGTLPPLPVSLPDDPRVRDLVVTPHVMEKYNTLMEIHDEN